MGKFIKAALLLAMSLLSYGAFLPYDGVDEMTVIAEDSYDIRMVLRVPQVLNNTESQGERRYQTQWIRGKFYVDWFSDGSYSFDFGTLTNNRFKVGGKFVTYRAFVDYEKGYPRFSWIGSNRTGSFLTPTLYLSIGLLPSYAIGEMDEDNSFYIDISGKGTSRLVGTSRVMYAGSGKVSGKQGCSCGAYGHISPSRDAGIDGPTDKVTDVVAADGIWRIKWTGRTYR